MTYYKVKLPLVCIFKTTRPYLYIAQSKIVFTALAQSILDYADSVWSHCSSANNKPLQVIQNKGMHENHFEHSLCWCLLFSNCRPRQQPQLNQSRESSKAQISATNLQNR